MTCLHLRRFVVHPRSDPTGHQKLPCLTFVPPSEQGEHTFIAIDPEADLMLVQLS